MQHISAFIAQRYVCHASVAVSCDNHHNGLTIEVGKEGENISHTLGVERL